MIETNNPIKPAVSDINGLNLYDSLFSTAVKQTAARKIKTDIVLSAVSKYEKIAVSSSVIKSVLTSYLHEIDEEGFNTPSYHGRVLLSELKYNPEQFEEIIKEPEQPVKPEQPIEPEIKLSENPTPEQKEEYDKQLKTYEAALNEYKRLLSDFDKDMAVYQSVVKERAAGVYRSAGRVFVFSDIPTKEGIKPEQIKVYLFGALRLDKGKFSADMLSGDNGISAAAALIEAVGVDNYLKEVEKAAGLNYELSEEERAFIASYVGVSLSERADYLLLKANSENSISLSDEEYEKAIKSVAKSIFGHLKSSGKTAAKKDRVIPSICIELKRSY